MSEKSLEVLAIAIFAVTMSALLGPVLGLSPVFPAAIAIAGLGLAGIDAAIWQGKGGAFFMAWLQSRSSAYVERVLHHEAGHFLVAHLLGFEVSGYALHPGAPLQANWHGEGGVAIALPPIADPALRDRCCTVWMAGIAAEALIFGDAEGGEDDLAQLRRAIATTENPAMQERWALFRARSLLQAHRRAYDALAIAMGENRSVEECIAAIEASLAAERDRIAASNSPHK